MARRPSPDNLPEAEAEAVRELLREARKARHLQNEDLAKILDWDVRAVTDVMGGTRERPLRAARVELVFRAILSAKSKHGAWDAVRLHNESMVTSKLLARWASAKADPHDRFNPNKLKLPPTRIPAVLLHSAELRELSQLLAAQICGGAGGKRHRAMSVDIENAFLTNLKDLTWSAYSVLWAREGDKLARLAVEAFGWRVGPLRDAGTIVLTNRRRKTRTPELARVPKTRRRSRIGKENG